MCSKNFWYFLLVALLLLSFYSLLGEKVIKPQSVPLSEVVEQVKKEKVEKIVLEDNKLTVSLKDGKKEIAYKESEAKLTDYGITPDKVKIEVKEKGYGLWWGIASALLPVLIIIGFFYWMMRQATVGNMRALSFGETKARLFGPGKTKVTFSDVAGLKEAKQELMEVVEFLKNPQKFRQLGAEIPRGVLLTGPAGTGKCITGDSIVLTNKGPLEIQDIPKYFYVNENNEVLGARVKAFDIQKVHNSPVSASHFYNLGQQKTLIIKTWLGQEIEGTYEHSVVVLNKDGNLIFKRLDQIEKGELLAIKFNDQMFGSEKRIDEETAYLLGLLTGDGGLTIKNRICFSTRDVQLKQFVNKYFKKRFGERLKKTSGKYEWAIYSKEIKEKLINLGLPETFSNRKKIPEWVLLGPKEIVKAFLQGLFDADASFHYNYGYLQYLTSSKALAKQVSLLLLNLGIIHRFRETRTSINTPAYRLEITGDFLRVFAKELNFRLWRKKRLVDRYIKTKANFTETNLIPFQGWRIRKIWDFLIQRGCKPTYYVHPSFHKSLLRYVEGEQRPSRKKLIEFLNQALKLDPKVGNLPEYRYLKNLVQANLFFTPVIEIKKNQNIVYDFTVPFYHSFIANGMINHNTLLAKAVAGEAGVPFFSISASEFVEMFVGVGASRVRSTFQKAKKSQSPAIIFIDELDAVGRVRGAGIGGGHDEREQTLNQILVEMDGFETSDKVVVMAATNRPDILDPALLRPGRFDRKIVLDLPDVKEREEILKIHTRGKPLSEDVSLEKIAKITAGFSGADLRNLANEAAILAARRGKKKISQIELEESIEKVLLGPERKSHLLTEREKKITAYHETGHAICTNLLPNCDKVHKISIISRGPAAGYTWSLPTEDRKLHSKSEFEDNLTALLGGRTAEEIIFKEISTGGQNDLKIATKIAKDMVTQYGMSERLGPITYGEKEELIFLGKELAEQKTYSEETASKIDQEVKNIIEKAQKRAREILSKNKSKLKKVAERLIKEETIEGEELEKLLK